MLAINLEPELAKHLAQLAARNGRSVDELAQKAIERLVEDLEDIAAAEEVMRYHDPAKNITLDELRRDIGLDD